MLDDKISPMLAYPADPFDSRRHLYEIKWDGTRCLLFKKGGEIRLQNRRLETITQRYPELQALTNQIAAQNAILDGELVVLTGGLTDFPRLQQREHIADPTKISLLSKKIPATYVAFDLLFLNDDKLVTRPLVDRKERLSKILRESPHLIESRFVREGGRVFFQEAVSQGLEGIMAKTLSHGPAFPFMAENQAPAGKRVHGAGLYPGGRRPTGHVRRPAVGYLGEGGLAVPGQGGQRFQ